VKKETKSSKSGGLFGNAYRDLGGRRVQLNEAEAAAVGRAVDSAPKKQTSFDKTNTTRTGKPKGKLNSYQRKVAAKKLADKLKRGSDTVGRKAKY